MRRTSTIPFARYVPYSCRGFTGCPCLSHRRPRNGAKGTSGATFNSDELSLLALRRGGQHFLHRRHQLLGLEGLRQVAVSAAPPTIEDIHVGLARCHHDNGEVQCIRVSSQGAQDLETVHARHFHVEDDDVGLVGLYNGQAFLDLRYPVCGARHRKSAQRCP